MGIIYFLSCCKKGNYNKVVFCEKFGEFFIIATLKLRRLKTKKEFREKLQILNFLKI